MRGNHHILGRQDYSEPEPLPPKDRALIAMCSVGPRRPDRAKPHNWHEVRVNDALIGFVKTGLGGQSYRTPEMSDWIVVASDWSQLDPPHAYAILYLLEAAETAKIENWHLKSVH